MSAVSTSVPPASTKAVSCIAASSSSVSRPHVMVPSASRETTRPLRPSARCSTSGQPTGAEGRGPVTVPTRERRAPNTSAARPTLSCRASRNHVRARRPRREEVTGMGWFEAAVLGLVQGLTEFLPVSSSAHLRIVGTLFGWDDPGAAFTAITQIGTEVAVVLYYRKKTGRVIGTWRRALRDPVLRKAPDARMGWLIIIG